MGPVTDKAPSGSIGRLHSLLQQDLHSKDVGAVDTKTSDGHATPSRVKAKDASRSWHCRDCTAQKLWIKRITGCFAFAACLPFHAGCFLGFLALVQDLFTAPDPPVTVMGWSTSPK